MVSRGYTWIDESEHSNTDSARAAALAKKWSELKTKDETDGFLRMARLEDGDCGPEADECETCGGEGFVGVDGQRNRRGMIIWKDWMVGIKCPNPHCEDGYDMQWIHEAEQRRLEISSERDIELEIIEEMLTRLGARIMRPYEHWNEDERYMEYMETRNDY